jgi:hypothetical protein
VTTPAGNGEVGDAVDVGEAVNVVRPGPAPEAVVATNGHHPDTALAVVAPAAPEGPGDPGPPDLRYVAVGAVLVAGGRVARLARGAVGASTAVARPAMTLAGALVPGPVRAAAVDGARRLEGNGRSTVRSAAQGTARAAEAVADRFGDDPLVLRLVHQIVGHVQWQVIDEILPAVLERLATEPEQVRDIVQGQSWGMVEEVTEAARTRAVAGDEVVDRLVARLLRRRPQSRDASGTAGGVARADGQAPPR